MGVTGSWADLAIMRRSLATLGAGRFRERVLPPIAEQALSLVRRGFRASVNPYGNAWAPLKWRKGKPLRDTGQGANSFAAIIDASGFRVESSVEHLAPHQTGARMRRRARFASVASSGRFTSRARAARNKRLVKVRMLSATDIQIPARPMVPDRRGLPTTWRDRFDKETRRIMRAIMEGK